jgi:hypothetical protein
MTRQMKALCDRLGGLDAVNALTESCVARAGFPRRARRSLPGLLPRTVQLCICCRESPAGFWVRGNGGKTAPPVVPVLLRRAGPEPL